MSTDKCPVCKSDLLCLGGESAHPSNWYCSKEVTCGWQAWNGKTTEERAIPVAVNTMKLEKTALIEAYKVNKPDSENVIGIRYKNELMQRITVFANMFNNAAVENIIEVINHAARNNWQPIDKLPKNEAVEVSFLLPDKSRYVIEVKYDDIEQMWIDTLTGGIQSMTTATHWRYVVHPFGD